MPAKIIIPIGTHFGKLTVKGRIARHGKCSQAFWECICECGQIVIVRSQDLRTGHTTTCGRCSRVPNGLTHGMSGTPEHGVWKGIKSRCLNPHETSYIRYGGRGITICPEWLNDFMAFYRYVGPRPTPEHTIERVNNDGNYEPGNVKWTTPVEQARNKRSNVVLTLNGQTHCAAEWAELVLVDDRSIRRRKRAGWSDEQTLTRPVRAHKPYSRK